MQHLKMWTSVSASRWMCLLTLAVVMLFYASEVDSEFSSLSLPCCPKSSNQKRKIQKCYEQKPRKGCDHHAFLIITKRNKIMCINPAATWIKDEIEKGKLHCPSVISSSGR